MSVYCITSRRGVGCTFFDWTIHFLSGQKHFYQADQKQCIPLCQDPVLDINAHGHLKNCVNGSANAAKMIDNFLCLEPNQLYSLYQTPLIVLDAAKDLDIPMDSIAQEDNYKKIVQRRDQEYDNIFEICYQKSVPLIYIANDPRMQLYYLTVRSLDLDFLLVRSSSSKEVRERFQQTFFSDSINTWNQLELTNIWDQRECFALNTRPFLPQHCDTSAMVYPHLWINCQDLWTRGEEAAVKMLKYLQMNLDQERLVQWRPIYTKWQQKQLALLEFCYNYKHIVDSVVNNWYYQIDLTFEQEVVIQHCLIYQHNLNLKTWELTKFPSNTQDLHKLLEPNIHPITQY